MNMKYTKGNKTRLEIFNTAVEMFLDKGYDNVQIRDIVKEVGVSIGSFYYHFPKKECIIDEGYRLFDEELQEEYKADAPQEGREAILYLLRKQIDAILNRGLDFACIFFKYQLGIEHNYYFREDRFLTTKLQENCKVLLSEQEAKKLSEALLRASRGAIYDWCLHSGQYDLHTIAMEDIVIILDYYTSK